MSVDYREHLRQIQTFPSLVRFLRDELDWPVETDDFEELTFDYSPEELGIDAANAAKIEEIKRLRPLVANQPWGIFFVKFEPKQLPVVALRRILNGVVVKKRATPRAAEQQKWVTDDLLFISNYGEDEERRINFAHFSSDPTKQELPTLKVLAWDDLDTPLHLEHAANTLVEKLSWPASEDEWDDETWRERWSSAFELRPREVIMTSKVLAERLAALARAIRDRITTVLAVETKDGRVTKLMKSFQEALIHDLDAGGFADMYAQTISYGLLSARVTNPGSSSLDGSGVHLPVTNPFLKELMETFLKGDRGGKAGDINIDFDELGVSEIVQLLDDANMDAVVRDFGDKNPLEDPVVHFYELFLTAYDREQKVKRGVFYTPRPVVSYIVRSVDELLRAEFGLEDGLADTTTWGEMVERRGVEMLAGVHPDQDFVQILDPATGTGTFLIEVVDLIHKTLIAKWKAEGYSGTRIDALWNEYVPKHLLPRLHGYEVLMAPYAIAHLKMGLKLYETGYDFGSDERARIFLTNALEPASDLGQQVLAGTFPGLAREARAVNAIKRDQRFTVVIGNPPYANFGRLNSNEWIRNLLELYKKGLNERKINLDDDYIKFVRLGHSLLSDHPGVLGYITNNSYLDGLTHRRMREALRETFPLMLIVDLHGNVSAQEAAPDGSQDENVFDIRQGVAIAILACSPLESHRVQHADLYGAREKKYELLLRPQPLDMGSVIQPVAPYFFLVPKAKTSAAYNSWPAIDELVHVVAYGIQTKKDMLFVGFTRDEVLSRMEEVFEDIEDIGVTATEEKHGLTRSSGWSADRLVGLSFDREKVRRVLYRPFDVRWIYYDPLALGRARYETLQHMLHSNTGLVVMRQVFQHVKEYTHFGVTDGLIDERTFYSNRGGTSLIPTYLADLRSGSLPSGEDDRHSNFNDLAIRLAGEAFGLKLVDGRGNWSSSIGSEDLVEYIYGVFQSASYRHSFKEALKIGFPRVPFVEDRRCARAVALLGGRLSGMHRFANEQAAVGHPEVALIRGEDRTVARRYPKYRDEAVWINSAARFEPVGQDLWTAQFGGYPVCQKWLKDRQERTLSDDDVLHFGQIVTVLRETRRLAREIDQVIEQHGGWPEAPKAVAAA